MDELLTTKEAAEMLGIKEQSLRVRRVRGKGPFPVSKRIFKCKHGATVNLYSKKDIQAEIDMLTDNK